MSLANLVAAASGRKNSDRLDLTEVNGLDVSTVYSYDCGYETAIRDGLSELLLEVHIVERYASREEAVEGHAKWIKKAATLKTVMALDYCDDEWGGGKPEKVKVWRRGAPETLKRIAQIEQDRIKAEKKTREELKKLDFEYHKPIMDAMEDFPWELVKENTVVMVIFNKTHQGDNTFKIVFTDKELGIEWLEKLRPVSRFISDSRISDSGGGFFRCEIKIPMGHWTSAEWLKKADSLPDWYDKE